MSEEQKTVFISYRRKPASFIARAIFQDLREHGYDVFMDVEDINAGEFGTVIDNQIKARAHFIIVLTTGTVGRFDEPKDWLRHEIEYAMEQGRNIIPLTINDFKFDKRTKKYLTGDLEKLPTFNAINIRHEYFDAGMEKLRTRFLKAPEYVAIGLTPPNEQKEVERKIEEAAAQPTPTPVELTAEDYFNMGLALSDNSDQGIAYYTEAIRLNPQYVAAYYNRGNARKANGDLAGAIADYNEAIGLNPQYVKAYNNRGNARKANGDLAGAIADFDEAIRLNPQLADAYNNRGAARQANSDLIGAIADFDEAIRLNPQLADAYNNRGATRKAKGDLTGAIADHNEAIRLNPNYTESYYNRGIARQARGDFEGAIANFKKYLDLGGGKKYGDRVEVEIWIRNLQAKLKSKKP